MGLNHKPQLPTRGTVGSNLKFTQPEMLPPVPPCPTLQKKKSETVLRLSLSIKLSISVSMLFLRVTRIWRRRWTNYFEGRREDCTHSVAATARTARGRTRSTASGRTRVVCFGNGQAKGPTQLQVWHARLETRWMARDDRGWQIMFVGRERPTRRESERARAGERTNETEK